MQNLMKLYYVVQKLIYLSLILIRDKGEVSAIKHV